MFYEQTLSRENIFNGKVFDIHRDRVKLSDNSEAWREVVEHSGGVCIAAIDESRNIILVEQFRYPLNGLTLEVVAGKLDKGEDPDTAASRELSEETGFSAKKLIKVGTFYSSPGFCSEKLHFYLATGLTEGEKHPDEGELLNSVILPLGEAIEKVLADEITDGKTKALILLADRILSQQKLHDEE